MKIILTGATGFIGSAVLRRLLALDAVTQVVALSRRALPVEHAKLSTVIVKDFANLEGDVLESVEGAQGCVWVLGSPTSSIDVHDGYTSVALEAFEKNVLPSLQSGDGDASSKQPFRFVYTSGSAIVRDQEKFLLFMSGIRKGRGVTETKVAAAETAHPGAWKSFIVRPALVLQPSSPLLRLLPAKLAINVDMLGAAMADLAVTGSEKQTFSNPELRDLGASALVRAPAGKEK